MDWTTNDIEKLILCFANNGLTDLELCDGERTIVLRKKNADGRNTKEESIQKSINESSLRPYGNTHAGKSVDLRAIAEVKELQDELAAAKENLEKHTFKASHPFKVHISEGNDGRYVKSSFAGIFYRQPSPGAEPYAEIGQHVKKGDVLCLIEAMKMINEITAPCDGVVKEFLFENEQFVEYDSPLVLLTEE